MCLEQDAKWYDEHNPTEMASKISRECTAIQTGLSEKSGQILQAAFGFTMGYVFAFTFGFKFTLVLLGCFPVMVLLAIACGQIFKKGISEEMRSYA